jgi:trk system potassium uptake protein TrkH
LPIKEFTTSSLIFMVFLMFIGASPGSTGGGIKTCTFAVIGLAIYSMFMKRRRVNCFNRSIPQRVIRESLVIFFLALCWIFAATMILAYTEGKNGTLTKVLFEAVSAFGTVGLSTGITGELSTASKLVVIATMFVGRVGPLTMALAVAFRESRDEYTMPEESIMVG